MSLFYEKSISQGVRQLDEIETHHCLHVLRKQMGDEIRILDGNGTIFTARISGQTKRNCPFEIIGEQKIERKPFSIHLAIAPTKNVDRMEWMIEKLGEIGVDEITFLKTANGERSRLRIDRLEKKAISAMKQCGSAYLMKINDLMSIEEFMKSCENDEKWIAHLGEEIRYLGGVSKTPISCCILIGPEGDFNLSEIELAEKVGFMSVSLGQTTLRTETAGLLACHIINVLNAY